MSTGQSHAAFVRELRDHARQRAKERYGLDLSDSDFFSILRLARENRVLACLRSTCSRSVMLLRYHDMDLLLVYSREHREIVTFLPPDDRKREELEKMRKDRHYG